MRVENGAARPTCVSSSLTCAVRVTEDSSGIAVARVAPSGRGYDVFVGARAHFSSRAVRPTLVRRGIRPILIATHVPVPVILTLVHICRDLNARMNKCKNEQVTAYGVSGATTRRSFTTLCACAVIRS